MTLAVWGGSTRMRPAVRPPLRHRLPCLPLAGAKHEYKVQATGGPLSVTLVWADYPALPSGGQGTTG